jgi:Uma2 family endonuclease
MTAARKLMTPDEFLTWCLDQEGKWELVGGEPILMMAGATRTHDRIVVNLIVALDRRLRGGPCRPNTDDVAARIPNGNIRRPDVTVDCGAGDERAMTSETPLVFFEVLSPSTRAYDLTRKPLDYQKVTSLRHLVLVDPEAPRAFHLYRGSEGEDWRDEEVVGLDAALSLGSLNFSLPLAEIFRDVRFDAERQ